MLLNVTNEGRLARLAERLRLEQAVTSDLMSDLISDACLRIPMLNKRGKATARLNRLIDASAWIDAALALVELELPHWKLRRLVYEDGSWFCSLSKQPDLPVGLDDTADATHESQALAILCAFLEACGRSAAQREVRSPSVPNVRRFSKPRGLLRRFRLSCRFAGS